MANILNVGPIVPVDKGVYSSATTYSILNLVDDGTGQVYLSKKNNNLGNNLTNGEWWGRYTGPQGPQGVKGDTGTINLAGEYGTSENVGLNQKFLTEKMAGFEEVVQTQLITTPPATLNAQVGYYYCMGGSGVVVDTMTIQLPAISDYEESKAKNVSFFMIMGSAPAVTFVSAGTERIRYQKDFALEAERGYEVNALWNSHAWVIAAVEIIIPMMNIITYEATAKLTETTGHYSPGLHTNAFSGKSGQLTMTSHTFENGVGTIKFDGDVTGIGEKAFSSCSDLTSITIPNSVTSIGEDAFFGCSGLTSVTIPNSVTNIGNNAFYDCTGLTSVTIPDSVTSIDSQAFYGCSGLTNITIPDSVTSISSGVFSGCSGLTSITIPDSVTSIGNSAFRDCTGLTNITIPDSVTSISSGVFQNCTGLTSIAVDSDNTVFDSRDNCNAIINTSTNELIAGCKNTVIPSTVTRIGSSAFSSCTGLTSVTIPDSVTSIGSGAFYNCTGLTNITIPDSVTSISSWAFQNCTGLTSITCNAITAPTIQSNTFHNVKTGGTLTVPSGSTGYDEWIVYLKTWTKVEQ